MAIIADCSGCMAGKHEEHVEHWGTRPEGIIDGEFCYCKGDCAERTRAAFDEFFGNMADIMAEDPLTLSPEAQRLLDGLKSTDPAKRNEAVREVNRLLAEDPLPGEETRVLPPAETPQATGPMPWPEDECDHTRMTCEEAGCPNAETTVTPPEGTQP